MDPAKNLLWAGHFISLKPGQSFLEKYNLHFQTFVIGSPPKTNLSKKMKVFENMKNAFLPSHDAFS